jgi:hypothetical protein
LGDQPSREIGAGNLGSERKNPLTERAYPKRLMGLEPTTFCMASSSCVFGEARKALQIGWFLASSPKGDARGLPAIHGDLANQWQTVFQLGVPAIVRTVGKRAGGGEGICSPVEGPVVCRLEESAAWRP